jgi:DNA invertase Pin-like site-specific DNA recombinase
MPLNARPLPIRLDFGIAMSGGRSLQKAGKSMVAKGRPIGKATCAVYHRVSTRDQNPKLAGRELRQAAAARGLRIVLDVSETGSGARNNRPGLRRVMDAARRGEVGAVLVWKLDRFGRSSLDVLSNIRALADGGVRFVAVTQGLDVKPQGDAISQLILTVLSGVAEFERSLIAERTALAARAARQAGRPWGRHLEAGPEPGQVKALRAKGASWNEVATRCGCTVAMARRRAAIAS